ncbi:MAG: PKD domain-containing protein [Nitrospiraceae bacterium]|nr:MAG: PKD domain-containing protein [Nitrospiraceae bacterium]
MLDVDKDVVQKPVAKASATPLFGTSPLEVTFDAGDSFNSTGGPLQFLWRFDDGKSSTDISPKHRFSNFGTYMVELTVTNSEGQEDTDWIVIIVN